MGNLAVRIFPLLKSMRALADSHPFSIPFLLPSFSFPFPCQLAVTEHTAGSEVCALQIHLHATPSAILAWSEERDSVIITKKQKTKNPGSVAKEQQADVKQRDTSHSNTLLSSWEAASSACWRGATGKASFLMFNFGLWSSLSLQEKRPLRNA